MVVGGTVMLLHSMAIAGADEPERAQVRVSQEEWSDTPVSRGIYGNFIELGFGRQVEGMWSELLFNRSFEEVPTYTDIHWFWLSRTSGYDLTTEDWWHSGYEEYPWELVDGNPQAEWRLFSFGGICHGRSGGWLVNKSETEPAAFKQDGIYLKRGESYAFRGALRAAHAMWDLGPSDVTFAVEVTLCKEGTPAELIATHRFENVRSAFTDFSCTFANEAYEGRASIVVQIPAGVTLNVDAFSLMPVSNIGGWRKDAVEAAKQVGVPLIRWPGGCFTSFYHWREGIGPRSSRVPLPSVFWGGLNDNDVGTPEFMVFCRLIGAEPMICINMITGQPEEAAEWVAYCNAPADHPVGKLRARDGATAPHGVVYWELDNETYRRWGPLEYAEACVQYSRAMKAVDAGIKTIMVAYANFAPHLGEMLNIAGEHIYYVTDRSIDERELRGALQTIAGYNAQHGTAVKLCNTEWLAQMADVPTPVNNVNRPDLPSNETIQNRQIRWHYGMNIARQLMIFQRLGGQFEFATFNNFANTWGQNIIECPKETVFISAAGRVFELLSRSPAAWPLKSEFASPAAGVEVQYAWDMARERLVIIAINATDRPIRLETDASALGASFSRVRIETLSAPSMLAHNSVENPNAIARAESETPWLGPDFELDLPPRSVTHAVCAPQHQGPTS